MTNMSLNFQNRFIKQIDIATAINELNEIETKINKNKMLAFTNIIVSAVPKKYSRMDGFSIFKIKASTDEERQFLELYHEAHKELGKKCPVSKGGFGMRSKICQRILKHIDSIFDMTKLKGDKNINAVRIIKDGEIKCLKRTIDDIRSKKNGNDYIPSCDNLMDKIHRDNLVNDRKIILQAIKTVNQNSDDFNKLTKNIRQVTQDEFITLLFTPVQDKGLVQKIKGLTGQYARALFDFIDTNIHNGIASRNYMVSNSELGDFMNDIKRKEKLKLLTNNAVNKSEPVIYTRVSTLVEKLPKENHIQNMYKRLLTTKTNMNKIGVVNDFSSQSNVTKMSRLRKTYTISVQSLKNSLKTTIDQKYERLKTSFEYKALFPNEA